MKVNGRRGSRRRLDRDSFSHVEIWSKLAGSHYSGNRTRISGIHKDINLTRIVKGKLEPLPGGNCGRGVPAEDGLA